MNMAKPIIVGGVSKYQIGAMPGHRAQEHLFTLKSIIQLYTSMGLPIIVQFYDIQKFFDKESLRDGMNSIFMCGLRGKLYRLIYILNKNTKISVCTAVGNSEYANTGENIGQGSIEGAIISAANIDYSVNEYFKESTDELSYGQVRIQPLLFQDDITRISTGIREAQAGNIKMERLMETKLLDFNLDKSGAIVFGSKKAKGKIECEMRQFPLTLCGKKMKLFEQEKYLGETISSEGLEASVWATIYRRKGLAIASIFDIRSIVEDCRSSVIGGILTGLEIWELAVIPFLLNNCETWSNMSNKAMTELEKIQETFYRTLLSTPKTCPIPALYWDTGGMTMKHRIACRKLAFYHHLMNLPHDTLAYEIAMTQKRMAFPGLVQECIQLCSLYGICDNPETVSKYQWKNTVKSKVKQRNREDLLDRATSYKKLNRKDMGEEDDGVKQYLKKLNLPDARLRFALRSRMTQNVQMNFKGHPEYARNKWQCKSCKLPDTQEHILVCPAYKHLRSGKDLRKDNHITEYFRQVIRIRDTNP